MMRPLSKSLKEKSPPSGLAVAQMRQLAYNQVMANVFEGPLIVLEPEGLEIPRGIVNLARFREWTRSEEFPERGRVDWLAGRLELDMSPEDLATHGTPKSAIAARIVTLIQETEKGFVFIDRARFACPDADLSAEPDVLALLVETLESGRARLIPVASGAEGRFIEIEGTVDLVVEVISNSSVAKDKKRLREAYWNAGVREYWTADVRGQEVELEVLSHCAQGYELAPQDTEGFALSAVLGLNVRLRRRSRAAGLVFYGLEVR